MDLGIKGKRALVCASSKGLGFGCAQALAEAGVDLVMNARGAEALEAAAQGLRDRFGVSVETVAVDITTPEGQRQVLQAAGQVDILVNNAGGPPPGMWTDWEREDFIKALDANMLTPIALMKALLPGMMERGWGRVVNITSQSVKAPIPTLELSNGARAGLTGGVAALARKVARHDVAINNLLPGPFATDRLFNTSRAIADKTGRPAEEVQAERAAQNPTHRFGTTEEFGAMCAFLCSAHAGYIVGQNVIMDGGSHMATI